MTDLKRQIVTMDPTWEEKYASGHAQTYPWDMVVSFVFRNAPRDRPRTQVRILEVGFGTGPNLWFAAREGFAVAGVEGSASAVEFARKRFANDGLTGDLRVGDFTQLPFENDSFDLVVDRASLVCVGKVSQEKAINEIYRCLRRGGRFLHNVYGDSHSSFRAGELSQDGLVSNITGGTLIGVGQLHFTSRAEINERFSDGWRLMQVQRREWTDMLTVSGDIHSEWVVIAEKL